MVLMKAPNYIASAMARTFATSFAPTRPVLGMAWAIASDWETMSKKAVREKLDARPAAWAERTEKPAERFAVAVVMVFSLTCIDDVVNIGVVKVCFQFSIVLPIITGANSWQEVKPDRVPASKHAHLNYLEAGRISDGRQAPEKF